MQHGGKSLLVVLPSLDLDKSGDKVEAGPSLANPLLAFVKAFRLKGDSRRLSSLLAAKFTVAQLVNALKDLWSYCHADLVRPDFAYRSRRSTDPVQLLNTVFSGLMIAFDKLDLDSCFPVMFCKANNLLLLPTLDLHPVSKQLELNTSAVNSLTDTVLGLQSSPTSTAY